MKRQKENKRIFCVLYLRSIFFFMKKKTASAFIISFVTHTKKKKESDIKMKFSMFSEVRRVRKEVEDGWRGKEEMKYIMI